MWLIYKYIEWINTSEGEKLFEKKDKAGIKKLIKLPWITVNSPQKGDCKPAWSAAYKPAAWYQQEWYDMICERETARTAQEGWLCKFC